MDGEYERLVPDYEEYRTRKIDLGESNATGLEDAEDDGGLRIIRGGDS
jgi:hypothetical protein